MRKLKKTAAVFICLCLLLLNANFTFAAERPIRVYLDSKLVNFGITDGQQVQALTIYDYAYVPIARIIEILTGKAPAWNDPTKTASFDFNGKSYAIDTRQSGIYVNGTFTASPTGTPPVIINSRTLIPLKMLSTAMGFSQNYDAATHSTWLTSPVYTPPVVTPPPAAPVQLPVVNSVTANKTSIQSGDVITLAVRTNTTTSTVKVEDSSGRVLAESKSFRPEGTENVFSLDLKPSAGGTVYVYAGSSFTYNENSYKTVDLTVSTVALAIDSVTTDIANPATGTTVSVTIVTSTAATKVWLNSTLRGNFAESVSGYTDSGTKRTWKITYIADVNGYQNLTAYASDVNGNTVNRSFSLDVISQGRSVIYDAYASPPEIDANASAEIIVVTSTNVTSLSYNIISGYGSVSVPFQTTGYTDNTVRGERTWRGNIYYPGAQSGVSRITVTAATNTAVTASTTVSVNVRGVSSTDLAIYSLSSGPSGQVAAGTAVQISVSTGLGVSSVTAVYNNQTINVAAGTVSGSFKNWVINVNAASSTMNVTVSTYNAGGVRGESRDLPITVAPPADTDSAQ
ncbi:MAG: copper amine oxidase N-terminal domain-containing protein [Clostridiales bacterium]|jgi:hypothetical protein|nr:copper amine oxidase N-terminal domain-containing protein [Clostridiales bacterium]